MSFIFFTLLQWVLLALSSSQTTLELACCIFSRSQHSNFSFWCPFTWLRPWNPKLKKKKFPSNSISLKNLCWKDCFLFEGTSFLFINWLFLVLFLQRKSHCAKWLLTPVSKLRVRKRRDTVGREEIKCREMRLGEGRDKGRKDRGMRNSCSEHVSYMPWTQLPTVMDLGSIQASRNISSCHPTPPLHTQVLQMREWCNENNFCFF